MKVFILLTILGYVHSAPQFDGIKNFFKSLAGNDKAGEVNGDYEQVPYRVINKTVTDDISYEIREYPSVKWACTEMTYPKEDNEDEAGEAEAQGELGILKALQKMMSGAGWKKRPSSKMFMKLFRYISGVNKERQEIEMTVPVLNKMTPMGDNMKTRMCFYLDSSAQANPPTPEEEDVVIEVSKPLTVAVYEFGGYAMRDAVWEREAAGFAEKLGDSVNSVETGYMYTASYDSPMKFWNRKNEVMFELKQ